MLRDLIRVGVAGALLASATAALAEPKFIIPDQWHTREGFRSRLGRRHGLRL